MRAVVIYESMFGNTERVARAVADGLRRTVDVDLVEVGAVGAASVAGADLMVVGGPTQGFSLSRKGTPSSGQAAKLPPDRPPFRGGGLRAWIASLPDAARAGATEAGFAAFDTRFRKPRWLTGSAARAADGQLRQKGYRPLAPAESFFVAHADGPLVDGELDRALAWGARLGERIAGPAAA